MKLNARAILENLNEAQLGRLHAYEELLRDRAARLGLVSASDIGSLWERHILDSLRGLGCLRTTDEAAFDVGSGAGLPGIPLAIALPAVRFVLIEPRQRRAAFLELALERLGLANASVVPNRAGEGTPRADLCLARALAPPAESWDLASPLLSERGRLVYWAGRSWSDEHLRELRRLGVAAKICQEQEFQWQGPLVIMSRFSPSLPEDG